MDIDTGKDYYAILGVSSSATGDEIKQAYRQLARRYHPDSRPVDTPTMLFHEIQRAYAVLGNPEKRRAYDRQRAERGLGEDAVFSWEILTSREELNSSHKEQVLYLLARIEPAVVSTGERLPLNLCLVIDRSTSMQGARMDHVKEAARRVIEELHDDDALAIVTFNDRAEVVLPSQSSIKRAHAQAKIAAIRAEGGTEILQGLRTGLAEIKKRHGEKVTSHLLLLTDGRTYGDDEECLAAARRAGARGISITAMGIGEDWNDALLDEMASRSGGTSAFIASSDEVQTLLQKKVRGLETIFAQGLRLKTRTTEGVRVEDAFLTTPYLKPLSRVGGVFELGALKANSPMNVLLTLGVRRRHPGKHRLLQLELRGNVPSLRRKEEVLKHGVSLPFTDEPSSDGEVPPAILSALSRITLYRMQEKAWNALEDGNVDRATQRLEMLSTRLLDLGERELAQAAMLEAGRIAGGSAPTGRGRKKIKYGTRSLALMPQGKPYD